MDRPLSTLSAKIGLAYRLWMIDADFEHALQLARKIRNDFAHSIETERLDDSRHKNRINEICKLVRQSTIFKSADEMIRGAGKSGIQTDFAVAIAIMISELEIFCIHATRIKLNNQVKLTKP